MNQFVTFFLPLISLIVILIVLCVWGDSVMYKEEMLKEHKKAPIGRSTKSRHCTFKRNHNY